MNSFLTVMCFALVATAAAKPNGSGYNYQPQNFVASGPVTGPQSFPQPIDVAAPSAQFAAPVQTFSAAAPQFAASGPQYSAPAPQYAAPIQQANYHHSAPAQQPIIVSKEIYIHSGPEETEVIGADQGPAALAPIHKNYRVVFIKAPSHNLQLNVDALKRTQAANEEKTVIYVLAKKPDVGNLQAQLSAVHTQQKSQKPEVHFIKYKTQQEANRAQQEIQAQYDALGGSTSVSDEGIAPVASVVGGGAINIGSVGSGDFGRVSVGAPAYASNSGSSSGNFGGVSAGAPSYSSSSGSNFVQTTGSSQQQFVQQSFETSHGSASSVSFPAEATGAKYLPPAAKK